MLEYSCNLCSFQTYHSNLWAKDNPWFSKHSSLAGALVVPPHPPHPQRSQALIGAFEGYVEQTRTVGPLEDIKSYQRHTLPEETYKIEPEAPPEPSGGQEPEKWYRDHDSHPGVEGRRDAMDGAEVLTGVKRHRNYHTQGFLCPNQTGTCIKHEMSFARRDMVNTHCKLFPACGRALAINCDAILSWGAPVTEEDLVLYDPGYHKPYRNWDGRRKSKASR